MDSWVKEYSSNILNYSIRVNHYITICFVLMRPRFMTAMFSLISLLLDIFHSLYSDHEFWSHSMTEKLKLSSGLLCIAESLYSFRIFFLPHFCISAFNFRYWHFHLLNLCGNFIMFIRERNLWPVILPFFLFVSS